jgi:hypothetical protein
MLLSMFVISAARLVLLTDSKEVADELDTVTCAGTNDVAPDSAGSTGIGLLDPSTKPFSSVNTALIGLRVNVIVLFLSAATSTAAAARF